MVPLILCGGSGVRLWPVSRTGFPKQFLPLFPESLMELTLKRLSVLGKPSVLTMDSMSTLCVNAASNVDVKIDIIGEPCARNTAPAIALFCKLLELQGRSNEIVGVFPADHLIKNVDKFTQVLNTASAAAGDDQIVTIGIKPTFPSTGFGYIELESKEMEKTSKVLNFHEKPSLAKAQDYVSSGNFFWNAGIFVFKVSFMIDCFRRHQPLLWESINAVDEKLSNVSEVYNSLEGISIDYAVMEKEKRQVCIPAPLQWSDLGSWDQMAELDEIKSLSNLVNLQLVNSKNVDVFSTDNKEVAVVGIEDAIVVNSDEGLLVCKKGSSQDIKKVSDQSLFKKNRSFEHRPWGRFDVLADRDDYKVKEITVLPNSQLSYQSHKRRKENWLVVQGNAVVILEGEEIYLKPGESVEIPVGAKHRVRNDNNEPLRFIEIQTGSYFGEDDIVRYSDDYGRIK